MVVRISLLTVVAIGYNDKAGACPSYGLYYHTGNGDRRHWIYFDEIWIGDERASFLKDLFAVPDIQNERR